MGLGRQVEEGSHAQQLFKQRCKARRQLQYGDAQHDLSQAQHSKQTALQSRQLQPGAVVLKTSSLPARFSYMCVHVCPYGQNGQPRGTHE